MDDLVTVTAIRDPLKPHLVQLLVAVHEEMLVSEAIFRDMMHESICQIMDETVRATMVQFGEQMNDVLSLANLRDVVIAELQKRVTTAAASQSTPDEAQL